MNHKYPFPAFLAEAARTPTLLRLQDVGMHCGCEYTDFPVFRGLVPYSRYDHSLGVSAIVWHFTQDPVQAMAGLLHDAATPVFAHVVDFLNGDHLTQESTEEGLENIINKDTALMAVLEKYGMDIPRVAEFHRYPIADCPSPGLCADRLEYTLSNAVHYGFASDAGVQTMYDDLTADKNEKGQWELQFRTPQIALDFARAALACGKIYVCDEDRYAMERLSRLLRRALDMGILVPADLYTREAPVIQKLLSSPLAGDWFAFRALHTVFRRETPGEGCYRIPAKKRCIDPLVAGRGRVTALFPEFNKQVQEFLAQSQDHYICAQ